MSHAIIMIYIDITKSVLYWLVNLKKIHSMIETCRLKNVVIFLQTILSFVMSRIKIKLISKLFTPQPG